MAKTYFFHTFAAVFKKFQNLLIQIDNTKQSIPEITSIYIYT